MKKIIYSLIFIALALLIIIAYGLSDFNSTDAKAENSLVKEVKTANENRIKLKDVYTNVPYDISQVNISRTESGGFSRVEVFDKNTGKFIEAYGEKVEPIYASNSKVMPQSNNIYKTSKLIIYKERAYGSAVTRLYTVLTIYSEGSFRQIESIDKAYWEKASDGDWKLENQHAAAISTTGNLPTTEMEASGTATIKMNATIFTVDLLDSTARGVLSKQGGTYYLRKTVDLGYRYSLY
ncbi:hypothetical protein [Thermoanaerobacterium thermosaccharolyticum]|jgi:hypothetical protein|uniref:Uncharacterized protein n=1 Tax=Thermoanaerobacterium thermosaccharolyticum (strain ATCC 7956 / DSM 571 / NCIMB 9385 / NCA 3814 / NCTC 13789 / WDCM 00135 / 2032) TaxID=580327 RepID=D9TMQ9_THETC|nr:hypothetical protein [Thermoanaerobacterium thermosaccharolyticum]ADL70109.1 conserved hypothetical protein [Thermoanaerobacterium thermosaccharolyticum DSM 571]KAA5806627.1 hypothetical protein F1655_09210 [Thermoanaerobacterium thermosaccharolyticum]